MKKIAVDVGSGFTQYRTENNVEGSFPSIVCPLEDKNGFGMDNKLSIVVFDGQQYLIGRDAFSYGGELEDRLNTLTEDWAGSVGWIALFYSAIASCDLQKDSHIKVVTGLPQAVYAKKTKGLKELLDGEHSFTFQGVDYKVTIEAKILPQAVGATLYKALEDPSLMNDMVGVIDIGTFTTGFAQVVENDFVSRKSHGCEVGVSQLKEALGKYLVQEKNVNLDPTLLTKVLMEKKYRYRGEVIEIGDAISKLCLQVAKPMLDTINDFWKGGNELLVFVAGGGAVFFLEAIQTIMPHAEIMNDPFYAVVRGMYSILEEE